MESLEFVLAGQPYIELVKLLKVLAVVSRGAVAKQVIERGMVTRNGELETRKKAKIRGGDLVVYRNWAIHVAS